MATRVLSHQNLKILVSSTLLKVSQRQLVSPYPLGLRYVVFTPSKCLSPLSIFGHSWSVRWTSYGQVNLVLSDDGRPKFQIEEVEPSTKSRYLTKKRLKVQRKREKKKRKEANKNDPRRIRPKGKKIKQKFPTAEARLKYKIEKAKLKEAMLVQKLKKYEVAIAQGPTAKPDDLSGEERFYLKKVSQKKSNYVPVGRRGVFGGVILNMHLHWKKHETVKVICKPCKPGQIQEFASEIARLSGGVPVNIIGDNTIVFYRGKNYVQPDVMSPIGTLSKKKALEKSKYEQSLETVRRFIAVSEKELELYYRHVALYGTPQSQNVDLDRDDRKASFVKIEELDQGKDQNDFSDVDIGDISESDEVEEEQLNQGKDQNDSSDIHVSGISESDEDDSSSEYNASDVGTEDGISTEEEIVVSDRDDLVLPNRV
ncbi:hypothetical protein QOZ80_1AG0012940 [Eleusine coracana subsp. coracana]|nr:hypothetical protein QOZ80_1AG0012940 [Eleusine coracana subsp. coracana]